MTLVIRLAGIALLFSAIAMSGCASTVREPYSVTKGNGLMTLSLQPEENLQMLCQGAGVSEPGTRKIACVANRTDSVGVSVHSLYPPGATDAEARVIADVVAHESCHVVHQVIRRTYLGLAPWLPVPAPPELQVLLEKYQRDPCHDEDFGKLHR